MNHAKFALIAALLLQGTVAFAQDDAQQDCDFNNSTETTDDDCSPIIPLEGGLAATGIVPFVPAIVTGLIVAVAAAGGGGTNSTNNTN